MYTSAQIGLFDFLLFHFFGSKMGHTMSFMISLSDTRAKLWHYNISKATIPRLPHLAGMVTITTSGKDYIRFVNDLDFAQLEEPKPAACQENLCDTDNGDLLYEKLQARKDAPASKNSSTGDDTPH